MSDFIEIESESLKEAQSIVEKNKDKVLETNWEDYDGQLYNTETDYETMELVDKSENNGLDTVVTKYIGRE